ncbi:MAG: metallophosphoesterase family protein [Anaerolineales bacterium]|nr:metallophosphoesterase family protein [Anaerolineales bacterium]MCB0015521.1 metallophosphoesterase family protein [Anaerolineales bacterium]MCB0030550.1 metallophosphoesterase family protein [Anaerolineales bacterium]
MRILIISDIHANLTAFDAVLADAVGEWEQVWCLGDVIGYGPDPNECIDRLKELDPVALSGNHDWAVLGKLDITTFNRDARYAIEWTRSELTEASRGWLDALPPSIPQPVYSLAHGSPRHPVWEYIMDEGTATVNFAFFDSTYCLVGHTHTPVIFEQVDSMRVVARMPIYNQPIQLDRTRLIINPGSVGQPRDSDPRACYAILDTELNTWEYRRVEYDIEATQERMRKHNMPSRLVNRLAYGW